MAARDRRSSYAGKSRICPPPQGGIPWGALLLGGSLAFLGLTAFTSDSEPKRQYCGACGRASPGKDHGGRSHATRPHYSVGRISTSESALWSSGQKAGRG